MSKPKSIDEYLNELDGWQKEVVSALRELVLETAPEVKEVWKWSQPVYEDNGPFAYIKAFKNSVNFGFWRGIDLDDPQGLLHGDGNKMRHVKLAGMRDFHEEAFKDMVRTAVALNRAKGDPTNGS